MGRRRKRIDKILQRPAQMRFDEVQSILEDFGFEPRRSTGSHVFFTKQKLALTPSPFRSEVVDGSQHNTSIKSANCSN